MVGGKSTEAIQGKRIYTQSILGGDYNVVWLFLGFVLVFMRRLALLNTFQRLQHDDAVSTDHDHSKLILLLSRDLLDGIV